HVFEPRLRKILLCGNNIQLAPQAQVVGLECCFIRLRRSHEQSSRRLFLPESRSHVRIGDEYLLVDLIAQSMEISIGGTNLCLRSCDLLFSSGPVENRPSQIQARRPCLAFGIVAGKEILLTVSTNEPAVPRKTDCRKIGRSCLLQLAVSAADSRHVGQQLRPLPERAFHLFS